MWHNSPQHAINLYFNFLISRYLIIINFSKFVSLVLWSDIFLLWYLSQGQINNWYKEINHLILRTYQQIYRYLPRCWITFTQILKFTKEIVLSLFHWWDNFCIYEIYVPCVTPSKHDFMAFLSTANISSLMHYVTLSKTYIHKIVQL